MAQNSHIALSEFLILSEWSLLLWYRKDSLGTGRPMYATHFLLSTQGVLITLLSLLNVPCWDSWFSRSVLVYLHIQSCCIMPFASPEMLTSPQRTWKILYFWPEGSLLRRLTCRKGENTELIAHFTALSPMKTAYWRLILHRTIAECHFYRMPKPLLLCMAAWWWESHIHSDFISFFCRVGERRSRWKTLDFATVLSSLILLCEEPRSLYSHLHEVISAFNLPLPCSMLFLPFLV